MRTYARLGLLLAAVLALVVVAGGSPASATGGNSITSPDTAGSVGSWTSVVLDASGNPVVSYFDETNRDLKVLHCNDPNCAGGDESITSPDTAGYVGTCTSLALDTSGYPVVSYMYGWTPSNLKVLHCGDANCSSGNSVTSPDTVGDVGWNSSLALDGSGNPVISYYDNTLTAPTDDLKVLHCGDANCTSGNSITSPDTGGDVGLVSSVALDASGNPVVSYYDSTNYDLKLLHCGDANCTSGNSITSPDTGGDVGLWPSLALDASGNPVVSYFDGTNHALKVLHCNDPNCAGADESMTSPDSAVTLDRGTSLALDGSGYPVVSYFDYTNGDLKVLHCNDPNCAGDDDSITSPDTAGIVGWHSSLALSGSGYPVVSYYDASNADLKVLHCIDPACTGVSPPPAPVGGIAELPDAPGSSGGNYVALAGLAAAVLALGAGGWYARRRWVR